MAKPELQQQLQDALNLPDSAFAYHATDLYVLDLPGVEEWLSKNYKWVRNVTGFIGAKGSDWAGKRAFDIPFAGYWDEKRLSTKR